MRRLQPTVKVRPHQPRCSLRITRLNRQHHRPVLGQRIGQAPALEQRVVPIELHHLAQIGDDLLRPAVAGDVQQGQVKLFFGAGGETAGACVQALGITQLRIGPQIDPGVPWCYTSSQGRSGQHALHLALKSGNFGGADFFSRAFDFL